MNARHRTHHPKRGWLRPGGAILVAFLAAGCAMAGGSPTAPASASFRPSVAPSVTTAPSTPATPAEMLAAALAPLRLAADLETTITVDGVAAVTSVGRSIGGATQLSVTTSGKTVDYVQIPPQAWARQSGGSWVLVGINEAPGSPLDVLGAPTPLDLDPVNAGSLLATYPASSLGLEGETATVRVTLGDAVIFRYEADTAGHPTVLETSIRPATSLEPITPPI